MAAKKAIKVEKKERFEGSVRRNPHDYEQVTGEDGYPIFKSLGGVYLRAARVVRILSGGELTRAEIRDQLNTRGKDGYRYNDTAQPIARLIAWGMVTKGRGEGTYRLTAKGTNSFVEFHKSIRPAR